MIIISDREEKLSHQDFIERMYTSIDTSELALGVQPYLRHCTSFAAYKVIEEYKKACKKLTFLKKMMMVSYYKVLL